MKKFVLFLLLLLPVLTFAQGKGNIRGFVKDSTNGEVVAYANVILEGTNKGTPTNAEGYYYIPGIPAGNYNVIISFVGYNSKTFDVVIQPNKTTELNVELVPSSITLDELSVIGEKPVRPNETDLGLQRISVKEIELMPSGAESDVFRVLQSAPGVSTTGDVTSKYYVRGGAGDQNAVLLNGVTVYNPFHTLGIFSVIDPEVISLMEFYKGGFGAEYGGRLSSILDIATKDGNKNEYEATAQASLLAGKLAVEGPIPNGSFFVTGRKSYYSTILKKYIKNEAPFDFYDLSFKVNYSDNDLVSDSKFIVHGFLSSDVVNYDSPSLEDFYTKNNIIGMAWNKVWSDPLFSVTRLSWSGFEAEVDPKLSSSKPRYNKLNDVSLDMDFTYIYEKGDEFNFGLQNKWLGTELKMENLYGGQSSYDKTGTDMSIYASYKFLRWENIGLETGVRAKLSGLSEKRPFLLEPRLSLTYRPHELISLKGAYGRYSQEIVSLSDENELISIFEPWVIVPDYLNAAQTNHYILGMKSFLSDKLTVEVEGYYKTISNMMDINEKKYTAEFHDYINIDGESYGVEFTGKYQVEEVFLKGSYTFSRSFKIKEGIKYTPRYDIRHSFNLAAGVDLGRNWQLSFNYAIRSGMPFTPIAGYYDRLEVDPWNNVYAGFEPVIQRSVRNSDRLPWYHRLDMNITKRMEFNMFALTAGVNIINLYDRQNIYYFDKETGEEVYMLPFFPTFTVKAEI